MSFYLATPNGVVPYHKLEDYGLKRLKFLLRLVECRDESEVEDVLQDASIVDQSDCLITDTTKDSISHHILRLLLGGCAETSSFFCESEKALFKLRLEKLFREEWIGLFQSLEKSIARLNVPDSHNNPMLALSCIVDSLKERFSSWSHLADEFLCAKSKVSFCLPYQMVLQLVAGRHVNINKGLATVPVKQLRSVLVEQFERLMSVAVIRAKEARVSAIRDERIKRLAAVLKRVYRSEVTAATHLPTKNQSPLCLAELWSSSVMFPPCMRRLTNNLRKHHRLKHHERIQLTLFLKELGLSVHDALLLWKHEYSEPVASNPSEACGRWQGNERRYIYNIRHLYGLEGSRKNYRAHSCAYLQDKSNSSHNAGGCPFVLSDEPALISVLTDLGVCLEDVPELPGFIKSKDYSRACHTFMCCQLKRAKEEFNSSCHSDMDMHLTDQFSAKQCLSDQRSTDQHPSPGYGVTSTLQIVSCTESNAIYRREKHEENFNTRHSVTLKSLPDHQESFNFDNRLAQLTHSASSLPAGLTKPHLKFNHEMECSISRETDCPVNHVTECTIRQTGPYQNLAKKRLQKKNLVDCQHIEEDSHNFCQADIASPDVSSVLLDNSCVDDGLPCQISRNSGLLPCNDLVATEHHSFYTTDDHTLTLTESKQRCVHGVVSKNPADFGWTSDSSPIVSDTVVTESEHSQLEITEKFHKFRHKKPSEYFWHCKNFL